MPAGEPRCMGRALGLEVASEVGIMDPTLEGRPLHTLVTLLEMASLRLA
jgi:hypothetical protein